MAVISITTTESVEEVVAGFPRTIAISTNIPSTIFYTLDGTTPTLFSNIYTGPIFLPLDRTSLTLSIMATNGTDTSTIVTETFTTNMAEGTHARLPRSSTDAEAGENIPGLYPFGTNPIQPNAAFENPANSGITVDNPAETQIPSGFDGEGNPNAFTNEPFNTLNYSIKYSTTDWQNKSGHGIGTLPAQVTLEPVIPPPESTDEDSNFFDPRAFVIFQNASTEDPNMPPHINRMYFSMEDPEKTRDGNSFYTSGMDAPAASGSFLRSHYNPRTQEITYYYMDSWTNKWIISTAPYTPNGTWDGNLSGIKSGKGEAGSRYVFEWQNFPRRVLF